MVYMRELKNAKTHYRDFAKYISAIFCDFLRENHIYSKFFAKKLQFLLHVCDFLYKSMRKMRFAILEIVQFYAIFTAIR